jgi:tRNA threonylcarbamoyl adenosine modification protein YjeE
MANPTLTLFLPDEGETDRLAQVFAPLLRAGDAVLLEGSIGAGKSQFCRALIRARLGRQEDVPSPTFTLVQTYDADVEIWHADLYRLTHPDEARELGLEEAFAQAICLVEWPDRLGPHAPANAIRVKLSSRGAGRCAEIWCAGRAGLETAVRSAFLQTDRDAVAQRFLQAAGWGPAERQALAGDASSRRYERLALDGETRILMDHPPGSGDDVAAFSRLDRYLRAIGLNAPRIDAENLDQGFMLLEDFGDGVFARLMAADPNQEIPLYAAAVDVLAHIERNSAAPGIPDLSVGDWATAADLALGWYRFAITGEKAVTGAFVAVLQDALHDLADGPKVMILRDYHAENLMWLPEREGLHRVGILDFQLAQMGQRGYDLVSLLQDARRDVAPTVEASMIRRYLAATGAEADGFMPAYAALGAQRALRILGIFARLCLVEGKAGYLGMIPRVWGHLQSDLAWPELAALRNICEQMLPAPTAGNLERIRGQCGNFR